MLLSKVRVFPELLRSQRTNANVRIVDTKCVKDTPCQLHHTFQIEGYPKIY